MQIIVNQADFLKKLPKQPGVYRFYSNEVKADDSSDLLYVGKAINLYNRVKSYFQKSSTLSPRISIMVAKIKLIEITITPNEVSALILENNLIKSLKPKYNIVFRDDKTYPLIRVTKHQFPKLEHYRGKTNKVDQFFGPYPNGYKLRQSIEMVGKLFRLRTCTDSEFSSRSRPCMLYQIKRCDAPCVNKISEDDYRTQVNLALDFLRGKYSLVIDDLTIKMNICADNYEFEQAAVIRDQIAMINQLCQNQVINNYKKPVNSDIVLFESYHDKCIIYLIILRNGVYIGDKHYVIELLEEKIDTITMTFMESYYLENKGVDLVHTNIDFDNSFIILMNKASGIKIESKYPEQVSSLIEIANKNIANIVDDLDGEDKYIQAASDLAKLLDIERVNRIECIDISHNHGENTVASLVVYENGVVDNKQYRRYNLDNTQDGVGINGNDLLAIKTVIQRRFTNVDLSLPEVILIDGGQLQYDMVKNTLSEMALYDKIRVIALYKGERRDPMLDILYVSHSCRLRFSDNKVLFKLMQNLRDEAHRFAITGHRKKQVKKMVLSILNDIPSIGVRKKQALIAKFGSAKQIAMATIEDLQMVDGIGLKLAQQIYDYFH